MCRRQTPSPTTKHAPCWPYYYAWWDPSNFGQTLFQPDPAYNSDDVSTMQRHVQEAQSAGIDGFVMSWYGNGDRTDTNLAHLLDIAQKTGFRATINFETPHFWNKPTVAIMVSTFNEWMESTQIEPSVQYGDLYLQITRQNADTYRAANQPSS
ncbi:MAG: hypothetical protein JOZ65_17110 [Chloroflexi bacterium]|nr:hypothetical protein [Chloroflexota bacterium]